MPRTARRPSQPAVTSEMNVTPMIDVLLVVLIIYIVVAMWRHVLPVSTPEAQSSGERKHGETQIVLEIGADGRYSLNGQPLPSAELEVQLQSAYRDRPAKLLFIAPRPAVPYREVVAAMDRARGAGIEVLAFMPAATATYQPVQ